MAIKTLDPRMIDPNITLKVNTVDINSLSATNTKVTNSELANVQSTNIDATSLEGGTLSGINLFGFNTTLTNITATNNVVSNFLIQTASNNITFNNGDNSKVYHIDTTTTPIITAVFPETLPNGFNVSLINVGIGVINLSATPPLNAIGTISSKQYTGVFVYKQNNQFYGIGVLE